MQLRNPIPPLYAARHKEDAMKRFTILAATAAAFLVFFTGCDAGDGAGNESQYTETDVVEPGSDAMEPGGDVVEPEPDTETDPCEGKLDSPGCTTDDTVEEDPEVIEPPVLTDCSLYTESFSGSYAVDVDGYNWKFDLPEFTLNDNGTCVSDTGDQPSITDTIVSVTKALFENSDVMACGPTPESNSVCFMLMDDGTVSIWGDAVGMTVLVQR
ncbi:hypothetical protein C0581_04235 [Candidatus Parcubacteria bacterium]|nr:MAG: hypothetical protein C0581_04235 [Candidatus Parcubacteria bacterium]